jgi:CelD/BcsL family acetyltransferase involved in cellulose biosynthesis
MSLAEAVAAVPAARAMSARGACRSASGELYGARGELYKVDELQGRAAFDALRDEWDALLAGGPVDQPFQKHAFIAAWLDAFAPQGELRVLVARDAGGRAAGMAPFLEERTPGMVTLRAPANDHSSRVEWVLGAEARGACQALWGHLRDRLRWDALVLRDVPRHGPTSTAVEELARRDGHPVGRWESLVTPYLALGAEPREKQVSSKFLGNLRRRMRRLEEQGAVSVRRVDGGDGVEPFLEAFFRLEAAGWKGQRGTAIAADPATLAFYRGLARAAAAGGWLALHALELDGRPVAMHFGLRYRGVHSLPKPAYEEGLGACSPGQLLFREVLAECEAKSLAELDFLGPDMPWKRDWAPALRPHDFLHVYRPGLSGAARHALKFRLKPLAKEVLSWWRR